ncbi:ATG27 domain-containing protein [Rhizoctonia solani AG-1 IA]|uniref:ATG27 domain-containing protein n=1 Tax=Thanatephorus cucumeris (strain AG1-IA) TaxID=983506 RepID=L8WHZ7_THACA|nr:ATG27 domain-containing protein [Rhizoctonia solani AG-1 IA]
MSVKRRASKLAVITLLQIGSVFALPTTTDSVRFDCIFSATSGGHVLKYDLCPLLSRAKYRISRDVETPPSITRIHYDISLGDYIPWDGTLPARDQCEQGTNVCMTVISERPDHRLEPPRTIYVVPVAGNFPDRQLNVTSKLSRKIDSMGNRTSVVIYYNLHTKGPRSPSHGDVPWRFIYGRSSKEPTLLSHADPLEDQGNHKLVWKSKHACPLGGYPSGQRDGPPEPTLPIPVHDPLPGSQDGGRMVGPGTVVIIVLLGMVIFGNLKRRWAGRHSTSRYRSFALSRVSPAVHHDADPRSPLTPHTPDAHHIRKYTTVD